MSMYIVKLSRSCLAWLLHIYFFEPRKVFAASVFCRLINFGIPPPGDVFIACTLGSVLSRKNNNSEPNDPYPSNSKASLLAVYTIYLHIIQVAPSRTTIYLSGLLGNAKQVMDSQHRHDPHMFGLFQDSNRTLENETVDKVAPATTVKRLIRPGIMNHRL